MQWQFQLFSSLVAGIVRAQQKAVVHAPADYLICPLLLSFVVRKQERREILFMSFRGPGARQWTMPSRDLIASNLLQSIRFGNSEIRIAMF